MLTRGYFGVPNPSGVVELGFTSKPLAENIERTMYWLDRVSEQHGWPQHYPTDPILRPSGFNWKRHNGLELETFDPQNSGNYNLTGYPISSKDFWNNFRQIITWAGDKILKKWDVYGGQVSGLRGNLDNNGYNWSNNGADELKWIPYGNYNDVHNSDMVLDNSGYQSFVDYSGSSKTNYMGRHGKITNYDYNQYVPFPLRKYTLIGYPYMDSKCVSVTKFVLKKNFNTISPDFHISRNELLTGADLAQVQQLVSDIWYASGVGSALIYPTGWGGDENVLMYNALTSQGAYYDDLSQVGFSHMINGYSLTRKQAIDGRVLLKTEKSSGSFVHSFESVYFPDPCTPSVETVGGYGKETINNYALRLAAIPFGEVGQWDVLDYETDSSGFLTSSNVITVKDRYVRGETREAEGLTGFACKDYLGVFFPMSTKYYSSVSGDRYYDDTNHYLRSFTGFTPNDSLDLISSIRNYGPDGHVSGVNSYSYNDVTYNYNQRHVGILGEYGYPPYYQPCSGNTFTVSNPSLNNNITNQTFDVNKDYDLKLVYGFVNYEIVSGVAPVFSVQKLITESIESNSYTDIANIVISGGYATIAYSSDSLIAPHYVFTFSDIIGGFRFPGVMIAPPGHNYIKEDYWAGAALTDRGFYNGIVDGQGEYAQLYERLGSISGLTDFNPTGNILYLALVNGDDVLSDFMSESMPALNYLDEQGKITINESYHFRTPIVPNNGNVPPFTLRFIGEATGSYSYSVYGCEMQNSGSFNTDNDLDYPTRLRSFGYKERSSNVVFQEDQKVNSQTYHSGSFPVGKGIHSSYGAINDGEDKIENSLQHLMTLYTDTHLFQ